jgi:hypothetical protein
MPFVSSINIASLRDLPAADDATVELQIRRGERLTNVRLAWAAGFANIEVRDEAEPVQRVTVPDEFARSFAARAAKLRLSEDERPVAAPAPAPRHSGFIRWTIGGEVQIGSYAWETFWDEPEPLSAAMPALFSEVEAFVRAAGAQLG